MKIFIEIFAVILAIIFFLGAIIFSVWWIISLIPPIHTSECTKWVDEYYWITWDGSYKPVGTEIEEARKLAGDKPLTTLPLCVQSN